MGPFRVFNMPLSHLLSKRAEDMQGFLNLFGISASEALFGRGNLTFSTTSETRVPVNTLWETAFIISFKHLFFSLVPYISYTHTAPPIPLSTLLSKDEWVDKHFGLLWLNNVYFNFWFQTCIQQWPESYNFTKENFVILFLALEYLNTSEKKLLRKITRHTLARTSPLWLAEFCWAP